MIRTGIDIVHIKKIKRLVKNPLALKKIFHQSELGRHGKLDPAHLAGIFAAKEAFFKAAGIKLDWLDVEIVKRGKKPEIKLSHEVKELLALRKMGQIDLSISHDQDYAIANVVILKS